MQEVICVCVCVCVRLSVSLSIHFEIFNVETPFWSLHGIWVKFEEQGHWDKVKVTKLCQGQFACAWLPTGKWEVGLRLKGTLVVCNIYSKCLLLNSYRHRYLKNIMLHGNTSGQWCKCRNKKSELSVSWF